MAERTLSHADRIRQVEKLRPKIDAIGQPKPVQEDAGEEISGSDDQRFVLRETFEQRNRAKQRGGGR